jgi:hypothetical protein
VRTVPRTVPGVVSKATPKGCLESIVRPISGSVCGTNSTVTWRLISEGKSGFVFRPIRTASCGPVLKAIVRAFAQVVCGPVWQAISTATCGSKVGVPPLAAATSLQYPAADDGRGAFAASCGRPVGVRR